MDLFNRKKKRHERLVAAWGKRKPFHPNQFYERQLFDHQPNATCLDEQTAEDVEFDRFFNFTDRTTSVIGQQLLYQRLRQNESTPQEREKLESAVAFYEGKDPVLQLEQLSKFKQHKDYIFPLILHGEIPTMPKYRGLIRGVQLLSFACLLFGFNYPVLWLVFLPIVMVNIFIHYRIKQEMGLFIDVFSRIRHLYKIGLALIPLSHHSETVKEEFKVHFKRLKKATRSFNFLAADTKMNKVEGANVGGYIAEVFKVATLMDVVTYYVLLHQLPDLREATGSLYHAIGEIDLALSVLAFRGALTYYTKPCFADTNGLQASKMYHPLIADPVSNDLEINAGGVLVTGSNMSGKSTFIKTLNLNALSAQNINTAFAEHYRSRYWRIATSINIKDNLEEGASYYLREVERIGTLLELSRERKAPYLITIDEVYRGTNTVERISSAKAVLEYLVRNGSLVIVSTHDLELAHLLENKYALYFFQEAVVDQALSFDYKLKPGIMTERNAISILEISGYPAEVVEEARRVAAGY